MKGKGKERKGKKRKEKKKLDKKTQYKQSGIFEVIKSDEKSDTETATTTQPPSARYFFFKFFKKFKLRFKDLLKFFERACDLLEVEI